MAARRDQARPAERLEVSASDLKKALHEYLDAVQQGHREVLVTRYGRPVAKLVPCGEGEDAGGLFGCLAGTVTIHGDIVAPTGERWDADA